MWVSGWGWFGLGGWFVSVATFWLLDGLGGGGGGEGRGGWESDLSLVRSSLRADVDLPPVSSLVELVGFSDKVTEFFKHRGAGEEVNSVG